jgi:predicted amidohydrolase YtcJ
VYVAAGARPAKSAILVRDGKIVFVGDAETARRKAPRAARLDLTGNFVFPGWADAHGHLSGLGKASRSPISAARRARRRLPSGSPRKPAPCPPGAGPRAGAGIRTIGPGSGSPTRGTWTPCSPTGPRSRGVSTGTRCGSTRRRSPAARIDAATPDPPGGRIVRRADGSASGVLRGPGHGPRRGRAAAGHDRRLRAADPRGVQRLREGRAHGSAGRLALRAPSRSRPWASSRTPPRFPIRIYATVATSPRASPVSSRREPASGGERLS